MGLPVGTDRGLAFIGQGALRVAGAGECFPALNVYGSNFSSLFGRSVEDLLRRVLELASPSAI